MVYTLYEGDSKIKNEREERKDIYDRKHNTYIVFIIPQWRTIRMENI